MIFLKCCPLRLGSRYLITGEPDCRMLTRGIVSNRYGISPLISLRFSSNEPPCLTVEKLEGGDKGIVVFRINRPKTKNAISKELIARLHQEADVLASDVDARVLILKSDVPGAFCSGADLKERKTMPQSEVGGLVKKLRGFADKIALLPIPSIAALDGVAFGGGLEFALACDIRVAAANTKMGLTETRLAIFPGAGGCQRLPRLIGGSKAKELIFTARIFDGKEAERLGVVNSSVEGGPDAAYHKALELAREIIPRGPIGVRLAKVVIDTALRADSEVTNRVEEQAYDRIIVTKDRVEGLAAFNEKRPPIYKGE
ncbi:hypothetical protein PENTCL1PPCAC_17725 [Pristionchus entomophagus]|uniref:Uncharacterized protein n=1 Tax=Pristionchus entomophagus TaxID=358040 RepID=A0AAV5TMP4_9BILA|nr:hypothetical protein PENTCL1PPCAC_17725 [Pristionchus entomophagus]